MKATKSAVRYAKALLELAIEQGKTDSVSADMQIVLSAFKETREFQLFLDSPIINGEKKINIFSELFPEFDTLTSSFIALMVKNRRENALAQIAASFESQLKAHLGIVPVTIVSARELDEATRNIIMKKLNASVQGKLELNEETDSALIGGFVIKMGDTHIDASVLNKIENLKISLTR